MKNKQFWFLLWTFFLNFITIVKANDIIVDIPENNKFKYAFCDKLTPQLPKNKRTRIDDVIDSLKENSLSLAFYGEPVLLCANTYNQLSFAQWHFYSKKYYEVLLQTLHENFEEINHATHVFPLTVTSKDKVFDINRYPCRVFHKDINNNAVLVALCEKEIGEIIIQYHFKSPR
ncbi:hypothetical protein [Bartonella sp. HY761]|uniref:hypothetical protein n=1 Tax=Bartonella sp. HY761 TaxID=2979330 RepID=UPI002201EA61|nr:hypothetical protein [Bartonella sp. HY761]UXN05926.1 hypothetical protein N6A79_11600 [Bartonella sp. HY761]